VEGEPLPLGLLVRQVAREIDVERAGQRLERLGERQPLDLHQEGEDVAALPAAEALVDLARRVDVEAGSLLAVERAEALERGAGGAERDVAPHDVDDVGLLLDAGDDLPRQARRQCLPPPAPRRPDAPDTIFKDNHGRG